MTSGQESKEILSLDDSLVSDVKTDPILKFGDGKSFCRKDGKIMFRPQGKHETRYADAVYKSGVTLEQSFETKVKQFKIPVFAKLEKSTNTIGSVTLDISTSTPQKNYHQRPTRGKITHSANSKSKVFTRAKKDARFDKTKHIFYPEEIYFDDYDYADYAYYNDDISTQCPCCQLNSYNSDDDYDEHHLYPLY